MMDITCQHCGVEHNAEDIYVRRKNGRKHFLCLECLFNDVMADVPEGKAKRFILTYKTDFYTWLNDHTQTYEQVFEEVNYGD